MIDIHTHHAYKNADGCTFIRNFEINNGETPDGELYSSVGWHPWKADSSSLAEIEKSLTATLIEHCNSIAAIGECGIDRVCNAPLDIQYAVFKLHIDIANKFNRPLIIHCVKAYSDIVSILKQAKFDKPLIFHSFNGNINILDRLSQFDSYFSFGYNNLFLRQNKFIEIAKYIKSDRIFLETDDSNISIDEVYAKTAYLLNMTTEQLCKITQNSFSKIFLHYPK